MVCTGAFLQSSLKLGTKPALLYFTDLNNDGCLTYNDFLWAKDKICYMSGWKIDSPKYKITEALFKEIWESLGHIADVDNDGKITKSEWV